MTEPEAEQVVRELAGRYGADPFSMPAHDLERLAEAVAVLGQQRVFAIAADALRGGRAESG